MAWILQHVNQPAPANAQMVGIPRFWQRHAAPSGTLCEKRPSTICRSDADSKCSRIERDEH